MHCQVKLMACLAAAVAPWLLMPVGTASADETFTATKIIQVPGGLGSFDIGFVDADIHTYVFADRTNASVDVIDTKTNTFVKHLTAGFAGVRANPSQASGPDGVIIVDHREVWAGDAPSKCDTVTPFTCTHDSSIKAIDIKTGKTIAVMNTGGQRRADELCEDVRHEVVLMANDNPLDSFITFWSTESHEMLGKISFLPGSKDPNGHVIANGIEQCQWDPRTDKFYLNIPATLDTSTPPKDLPGVVVVISTDAPFRVEKVYPVDPSCVGPAGMALGPDHQIALGCGSGNGPNTGSVIIDDRTGGTRKTLPGQFGDEIWYNPGDNHYFYTGDTTLGVVDANDGSSDAPATTQSGSHSVAADMLKNQVYVPVNAGGGICGATSTTGCVAVFTAKNDDKCLAEGMPVLDHDDNDDPVFMRTRCDDDRRADREDHDR
jgi:hypothetical protein